MRYLPYLLFVVVLPVVSTGGAVALLAGAFVRGRQPRLFRVLSAVGLLLAMGLLIFATAAGSSYSGLVAFEELIVVSAAALVGSVVLLLKPPAAARSRPLSPSRCTRCCF
jgi:NADH:ubiquinone oxidoreductase subunit 2 (subunit N)